MHKSPKICYTLMGLVFTLVLISSPSSFAVSDEPPPQQSEDYQTTPPFPINILKNGGYVIFFRHTSRDRVSTEFEQWAIDLESKCVKGGALNKKGEKEAELIKKKIEQLKIPVGEVYASPTCRTKQTAEMIFGDNIIISQGIATYWQDYQKVKDHKYQTVIELLSKKVEEGTNRFLVSHFCVFNQATVGLEIKLNQGDAAIFQPVQNPYSDQKFQFLGVIYVREWIAE